jgi:hypothetical protein
LQTKLRARRAAGFANPRPIRKKVRADLEKKVRSATEELNRARIVLPGGRPDLVRVREAEKLVAKVELREALGERIDAPSALWAGHLIMGSPVVAIVTFVAISAQVSGKGGFLPDTWAGVGLVLLMSAGPAVVMFALAGFIVNRDALYLSPSEIETVRKAMRTIQIASKDNAVAMLKSRNDPRSVAVLVAMVAHLHDVIANSVSWSSKYLEPHRVQFDVTEEVSQIARTAIRFHVTESVR